MTDAFKSIAAPSLPCKCCGDESFIFGVVDFNKRAERIPHARHPVGIPIYYHRCTTCGFIFSTAFDHCTPAELSHWLYNEEYLTLDGDYLHARPLKNMQLMCHHFDATKDIRILDYGCGNGNFVRMLKEAGFANVEGYDPFVPEFSKPYPDGRFDIVTCFEVVEHTMHPREIFAEMEGLLKHDGLIMFSTLMQPADIAEQSAGWWYVAPRNGHVSLFTPAAITKLASPQGLILSSFNEGMHVLHRDPPPYARHMFVTA